jgi:hypothetical protein
VNGENPDLIEIPPYPGKWVPDPESKRAVDAVQRVIEEALRSYEANRTPSQAEDEEGQVAEVREPVERTERVEDRGPVERIEDPAASAVEETFVRHHEIGTSPDLALRPPAVNGRRRRSLN